MGLAIEDILSRAFRRNRVEEEQVNQDLTLTTRKRKNMIVISLDKNGKIIGNYILSREENGTYSGLMVSQGHDDAFISRTLADKAFGILAGIAQKKGKPLVHKERFPENWGSIREYFRDNGYQFSVEGPFKDEFYTRSYAPKVQELRVVGKLQPHLC